MFRASPFFGTRKLQCPQLAKAITKKPDDLHPAHGSLLYMTIFYIIYTSLSIIYRQHRYFTLKKIRPRVILNIEKGKAREAATLNSDLPNYLGRQLFAVVGGYFRLSLKIL